MTVPVDVALLETAVAAAAGELLGLTWTRARSGPPPDGAFSRAERTFLLVWLPPALLRLLLLAPEARPSLDPELGLPLAAPASLALAVLVVLMPLAYWRKRHGAERRRGAFEAAGIAALAVAAVGFVLSPFDVIRLRDALGDHRTACAALARTLEPLQPEEARDLASFVDRETAEASAEATELHSRRGLAPALARLLERRRAFGERAGPLAASLVARSSRRARSARPAVSSPTPAAVSATRREAGCAAVEAGMTAAEVEKLLGSPDERLSAEDVLGPRAERWAYAKFLCRIHLVDDVVELVD